MTMSTEDRSKAMSVRAKLRKAVALHPEVFNATETKQVQAIIARLDKALKPVAKKKTAKKAPAKSKAKASTKKAPVKKAA